MYNKLFTIILGFLLLLGSMSQAHNIGQNANNSMLTDLDKAVYKSVTDICGLDRAQYQKVLIKRLLEKTWAAFGEFNETVFTADEIKFHKIVVQDHGLSSETATILDSMGLFLAIKDCYPDSEFQRNAFVLDIIMADALARSVGTVGAVVLFFGVGKVAIAGISKIYDVYRLTRWGQRLNAANKAYHVAVIGGIITSGFTAASLLDLFKALRNKSEKDTQESKELTEYIMLAKKGIEDTEQRRNIASSKEEQCVLVNTEKEMAQYLIGFVKKLEEVNSSAVESKQIQEAQQVAISTYSRRCS